MTAPNTSGDKRPASERPTPAKPVMPGPSVTFPNENSPHIIKVHPKAGGEEILKALQIEPPKALIMLSGGADGLEEEYKSRLNQLFSRGLVRAVREIQAAVITGGTDTGIMSITGRTIAERGIHVPLIGVMPAGCVQLPGSAKPEREDAVLPEPNHSHLALVESAEWGAEVNVMFELAGTLAQSIPSLMVLVNGGDLTKAEVLRAVRLRLPVIVIEGSGRLADEVARLHREKPDFIEDAQLAEIVADGDLHLLPVTSEPSELELLIYKKLRGDSTLKLAWRQFDLYDFSATIQQKRFHALQMAILVLGVLGTALVLIQNTLEDYAFKEWEGQLTAHIEQLEQTPSAPSLAAPAPSPDIAPPEPTATDSESKIGVEKNWLVDMMELSAHLMKYLIIGVPILISLLLAAANRFNAGSKWVLLRGSAESVKREIYRYRAHAEIYGANAKPAAAGGMANATPEVKLAAKLQKIGRQLMQSEVNMCALDRNRGEGSAYYEAGTPLYSTDPKDDGLSPLSPQQYISARLEDQMNYYVRKAAKLEAKLHRLQWIFYGIGGIGTLLAALGLEVWIALTIALSTAMITYMEYQQLEKNLMRHNQAATDLYNVRTWWVALSHDEQAKQINIDQLVGSTERILQTEFSDWVQEMQDAMEELRENQEQQQERLKNADQEARTSGAVLLPAAKPKEGGTQGQATT